MSEWINVKDKLPDVGETKPFDQGWLIIDDDGNEGYTRQHPGWWNHTEQVAYWLDGVPAPPQEESK